MPSCPYERLIDTYAVALPTLPQPRKSLFRDGKNAVATRQRWAWVMTERHEKGERKGERLATTVDEGVDWFRRFFEYVAECPHLVGENGRAWTADLGWLMTLGNFEKVLQGNYDAQVLVTAHA